MTPQELKASILQLAIQGKLVPQIESEGNAEDLYREIQKEKHIKADPSKVDSSAMDFDIPKTWTWVELNQLFDFVDYRGKTPNKISEGVFLITASNIKQGYMDYTRQEHISRAEYLTRLGRGITEKGDILFTTEAPMGNVALCNLDECSCGQRVITFKAYVSNTVVYKLYMFFMLSSPFQKQLLDNATGTTAKGIKADKLKHFLLPLPPLEEQKRIVAKIEELLPLVERYGKAYERLEEFNKKFPSDMKKSVLQMAIQGKLVEQRPEEGTAEELYELIQTEKARLIKEGKIKKEKPLEPIKEEEIPFDIPQNWKWVRWGGIVNTVSARRVHQSDWKGSGVPFYRAREIAKLATDGIVDNELFISEELYSEFSKNGVPHSGDLMITAVGTLGKTYIVKETDKFYYKDASVICLENYAQISADYLKVCMCSEMMNNQIKSNSSGTTVATLTIERMGQYILPLPPLEEQKRIVAKLEEVLPLCDALIK